MQISCSVPERKLEREFIAPPVGYRPHPLWFWNNAAVTPRMISGQVDEIADACGYGGFGIIPFGPDFGPEYLSDEYFACYAAALEKADEHGLSIWLYDEYGFPSGSMGYHNGDMRNRLLEKYPQYAEKSLFKHEYRVDGSGFSKELPAEGEVMSVVAMEEASRRIIDLRLYLDGRKLVWTDIPDGEWRVIVSICRADGEPLIDYLDPEAAECFTQMVHDEYYERFKPYFGRVIKGTFFDEPTLRYSSGCCWTPGFNEKFERKYGFSPETLYPALWYDIGESTQSARNYLFGFRAELYAEGFPKVVSDWSLAHGIRATGHQDNEERLNPVGTSGDLMKCFKYQDIPGIDKIGDIGGYERPAEKYYKIVSSAAYNWDRSFVMSETYGAMGDMDWDEIYSVAIDQYAKGINILIPHAFWYDDGNVTFPPELSDRHPKYAGHLPAFNGFLARLNILFANEGRVVNNVALYYPIETLQGEHYFGGPLDAYDGGVDIPDMDYVDIGYMLSDTLCRDYTFLHPEVMEERCRIDGDVLKLDNEIQWNEFSVLIVPSCKTISLDNLEKIISFYDAGGTIIFTTRLPSKATVAGEDGAVKELMETLFAASRAVSNDRGGRAVFVENPTAGMLARALSGVPGDVEFIGEPLHYMHKIVDGKHRYLFGNISGRDVDTSVRLSDDAVLKAWNPHTGEISGIARNSDGSYSISLKPCSALCLVEG